MYKEYTNPIVLLFIINKIARPLNRIDFMSKAII